MTAYSESAAREVVDFRTQLAFEHACPNEAGTDDFRKKIFSLALRVRERVLDVANLDSRSH
jgi:hypothetical protein